MADVLVEFFVLFVLDLVTGQGPQGGGVVDGFLFALLVLFLRLGLHYDWEGDVVGVLLDQAAQLPAIGEFLGVGFQVQNNLGSTLLTGHRLDGELAIALGFPVHTFFCRCAGTAGEYVNFVGNNKGGVKAHAELADQLAVFLLVTRQLLEEFGGARTGDGAEVGDDVVTGHADAVVGQGNGAGVFVVIQADFEVGVAFVEFVVFQGSEAQFVFGV